MKPQKVVKQKEQLRWKKPLTVMGALIAIYVLALFMPFIRPYAWFPLITVKCGHPPVIGSIVAASYSYRTPSNPQYTIFFLDDPQFFYCSVDEAKQNGFRPGLGEPEEQ